jgi:glycosidase
MEEFVFGTLATPAKRHQAELERRAGISHRNRLDPPAPRGGDRPIVRVIANIPHAITRIICTVLEPEPHTLPLHPVRTTWQLVEWQYAQEWQATLPAWPDGTLVRYTITADLADGSRISADHATAPFAFHVGDPDPPAWSREAVIYQIFPDRFDPGAENGWPVSADLNAIHGGTLAGITRRLDWLADLGINCLWLNPFFPDDTHHGYHATDYRAVNPRLGTLADLRTLVDGAHQRGMHLILDFVANHWGSGHPTFQDAQQNPASPYRDWYHWQQWPDDYDTFFGVRELPRLNLDHPAARDHLLEAARFWAEFGFDGFRLDYAVGPPHAFWAAFRHAVRQVRPDGWIFGEVVEDPDSQLSYRGCFDGCLDFLLTQGLRRTFATGSLNLADFDQFLTLHEAYFPADFSRPSFLDNHDMDRFLWLAGGDVRRLKLAALCQMTLAGPPILYYGTEVGLSQGLPIHHPQSQGMAEARRPMVWGAQQDSALHAWFRDLIRLRRQHPVFWRGKRRTVHLDAPTQTWAYLCADDHEQLLVAFNLSPAPQQFRAADRTLTLPPVSGAVIADNGRKRLTI